MAKKKSKKGSSSKGRTVSVDFTKVKDSGGGGIRVKEARYPAKVKKVELGDTKNGDSMLTISFQLTDGGKNAKGKIIKDRIVLVEQSLWRLRNMLIAMGKKVPKKAAKLNIDNLVGEEVGLDVVDGEEYRNKIRSEVADYIALDDLDEDEDEDDEDDDDEDEDEDEDEDDDDDDDDEDEDDLDELDVDEL